MATRRLSKLPLGVGRRVVRTRSLVAVSFASVVSGAALTVRCQETPIAAAPNAAPSEAKAVVREVVHVSWLRLLKMVRRCLEVLLRLLPIGLQHALRQVFGDRCGSREAWLQSLVSTLASLGPVGVKWGQWASTRYDLFSEDFCKALGQLTNDAPAHPYHISVEAIEAEFGRPLDEIFDSFDVVPLASGSIAQIHVATLAARKGNSNGSAASSEGGGRKVAVKVQHPDLASALELDMAILRWCGNALGDRVAQTVDQFAVNFEAQLDLRDEAANLRKFNDHFSGLFWQSLVSFPAPVDELVAASVLVESFEEGESVARFLTRAAQSQDGQSPRANRHNTKRGAAATHQHNVASSDADATASATSSSSTGERTFSNSSSTGSSSSSSSGSGSGSAVKAGESPRSNSDRPNAAAAEEVSPNDDMVVRSAVATTGMQVLLKMLILDNFVHADLHPGNVLIRMVEIGPLARCMRFGLLGDSRAVVPHIVLLDAGLAVTFDQRLKGAVSGFFQAILNQDGGAVAEAILGLDVKGQPFVQDPRVFVEECRALFTRQWDDFEDGNGRAGDNITEFFATIRRHRVSMDPAAMVAAMSMLVLEGWQHRLAPDVSIFYSIEAALGKGNSAFAYVNWVFEQTRQAASSVASIKDAALNLVSNSSSASSQPNSEVAPSSLSGSVAELEK